jgi:4-hydroxy-tetrahydrodipicolinate synthase
LRDWRLTGFTTGSGCIAPSLSQQLFERLTVADYEMAAQLRAKFIPLEDLRDEWGPARVLHHATELAEIARTGPIAPYVSSLSSEQVGTLQSITRELWAHASTRSVA